ncbi:MAG TPA: UDP-N-acetylmuramate--L-alanine ligase [Solirubrobacterales bacterium]|jgi:UDP-N-acetylmuramate--alanine ligase|nr:UDP-N-acetylmuramate--L-alanine ligase [Solirubrobacterales bacterium]
MSWRDRKLHFIGIGGAGMSGLALVAAKLGASVSGSDRSASTYTERLAAQGIEIAIGHDADQLPDGADVVVSTAIDRGNPELVKACNGGATVLHRSDLLSELAGEKRCIAVAGTHGKTTTTAMIAHVLSECGADPSFFVGGEVTVGGETTNARWGGGEWVVVEADESDRSFLKLNPEIAIVTNVELDHHTTYAGGLDELMGEFARYASQSPTAVVWRGQPELATLTGGRVVGFGIDGGRPSRIEFDADDVVASNVGTPDDPGQGSGFELRGSGQAELGVRGDHNVLNALAAIAAVEQTGIARNDAAAALKTFKGVARRFELVGQTSGGTRVYDDYAHHPTEVAAALSTARQSAAGGRVVAVFQPHLYSRTRSLAREFGKALSIADTAIVMAVYPAREQARDFPGVSGWMVATATADAAPGMRVLWAPTHEDVCRVLANELRPDDLLMTIGAGDITQLAHGLVES